MLIILWDEWTVNLIYVLWAIKSQNIQSLMFSNETWRAKKMTKIRNFKFPQKRLKASTLKWIILMNEIKDFSLNDDSMWTSLILLFLLMTNENNFCDYLTFSIFHIRLLSDNFQKSLFCQCQLNQCFRYKINWKAD